MRLLVCGGRDFDDVPLLWAILDGINARRMASVGDGIRCIIDGGQSKKRKDGALIGADHWAHQWALARDVPTERYFADWNGLGRSAGPIRNKRMRDEGRPTLALAMPGGRGTANMVALLDEARIPVLACDSDGTATAAANGDLPVPKDCQARVRRTSPNTPNQGHPNGR